MKRNKNWTDAVRAALRDAEAAPPARGWERLERELGATEPRAATSRAGAPAERRPAWRISRMRTAAAAAAAVLLCLAVGEYLRVAVVPEPETVAVSVPEKNDASQTEAVPADALRLGLPTEERPVETSARGAAAPNFRPLAAQSPVPHAGTREVSRGASVAASGSGADASVPCVSAQSAVQPADAPVTGSGSSASFAAALPAGSDDTSAPAADKRADGSGSAAAPAAHGSRPADGKSPAAAAGSRENAAGRAVRSARKSQAAAPAPLRGFADSEFLAAASSRKTASLAFYGAGAVSGGRGEGPGAFYNAVSGAGWGMGFHGVWESPQALRTRYESCSFRHHQPLSFGLSVRKEFRYGLSLESGVCYTLLRSDASFWKGGEEFSQKLHFIGIPLRLNWQFLERGRLSLYIGAGGMLEKCVAARFGTASVDEPGLQASVLGAAGAQYRLGGVVGLYFEPEVSYYFTRTRLRTTRTDDPLTLTLRLGVRLSF